MLISWNGQGAVQIKLKDNSVLIDPYSKESGLTPLRKPFSAVLLTGGYKDRSNITHLKDPGMIIEGPGEYEVGDVTVDGIESDFEHKQDGPTLYTVRAEGITLCHLSNLSHTLSDKQIEAIGDVDILFVPVGGHELLDSAKAVEVVNEVEPRIVVPIYYKIPGLKVQLDDEKKFLKTLGETEERDNTLVVKKSTLPQEDMKVVVLNKS